MTPASRLARAWADPRTERQQPRIAMGSSLLLHLLVLLAALLAPPVTFESPEGGAGSPVYVDFTGETPPTDTPPGDTAAASPPAETAPAASRIQATRVEQADAPLPADALTPAKAPALPRPPRPRPQVVPPMPPRPETASSPAQGRAQEQSGAPPETTRRPSHQWGQPPGMLERSSAAVHAGPSPRAAASQGRGVDASAGASLQVGGYQVYYDLRSETRLRAWQEQGMEELFIPLPGTRDLMVCRLEIALTRDSGECRLLPPDSPELARIGDARQVIDMHRVYRRGELVWRGPRPYR